MKIEVKDLTAISRMVDEYWFRIGIVGSSLNSEGEISFWTNTEIVKLIIEEDGEVKIEGSYELLERLIKEAMVG